MRDAALGNPESAGLGMGHPGNNGPGIEIAIQVPESSVDAPVPAPSADLLRNLCMFCQKARSIVVSYRSLGAFSCKKPCSSLDILSSPPVFSCTSPEVPSFFDIFMGQPSCSRLDQLRGDSFRTPHRPAILSTLLV